MEAGVHNYGILRAWGGGGVTHSGISEGKGGLKHGSCLGICYIVIFSILYEIQSCGCPVAVMYDVF